MAMRQLHSLRRVPATTPMYTSTIARLRPQPAKAASDKLAIRTIRRPFANKPSLHLVSRPLDRPQLPFLHSSANILPKPTSSTSANPRLSSRYLSTEVRRVWWRKIINGLKFGITFWVVVGLLSLIKVGFTHTRIEHEYPTPRDWSFWSRWRLRTAHWLQGGNDPEARPEIIIVDWPRVAMYYKQLLERLEDEAMDGSNILKGETLVEGIGRTGADVSMKSAMWRRGYFQALMGAATAAEHLEGLVKRKGDEGTWNGETPNMYPRDSIPGPSNPRPKRLPADRSGKPRPVPTEAEVEDAYAAPQVYYMKIMTTQGFNSGEKVDAALAYAEWCSFKGLNETARNMYDWALDIGLSALPSTAGNVIDHKTGAINTNKDEFVSRNLFRTTTALGIHHAQMGNMKDALAVFLSVLRARKTLPAEPMQKQGLPQPRSSDNEPSIFRTYLTAVSNYFLNTPYPALPPTGDERPHHTLAEACEEVGLMTYIGEILFASASPTPLPDQASSQPVNVPQRIKGLSWTRDSVEAAEAVMWVMDSQGKKDGQNRCKECLEVGMRNWADMAVQMGKLAKLKKEEVEKWQGVLGTGIGKAGRVSEAENEIEKWKQEEEDIKLRKEKTVPLLRSG